MLAAVVAELIGHLRVLVVVPLEAAELAVAQEIQEATV
jgi:hypothetical protein